VKDVRWCDSGQAALERLRQTPAAWDVVLMDMQMPLMDGLVATRQIRSLLGLHVLPVLGMTANVLESDRQACLDAGMNGHLGKPFNVNEMVAILAQWRVPQPPDTRP
jgi:CheY-like chemotaxis protein